ncbi:MAG: hypothetical protein IKJ58_10915 [Akkermansia sp.]|nr:hypothetical protein [Akkermansia sp.]
MITQKSILVKIDDDIFSEMEADIARVNEGRRRLLKRNRYINDAIRHYINSRRRLF